MKVLRNVIYVIIAMILGILINLLSLTFVLENVVKDEIITTTIKTSIATGYLTKNVNNLTDDQRQMIEKFLNDNEMNEIVDVLLDNYSNYLTDSNYKISQKDVDKIKDYVAKNEDLIKEVSEEDVDIDKILNEITVENIDKSAKEVSKELSDMPSEVKPIINSYKYMTVGPLKMILIGLIVVCIALMMLISWSLVKWMKATGVCLITNGVLISLIYVFVDGVKDIIFKAINVGISLGGISFNTILIIGLSELVAGIALVVVYNLLNKKNKNEKVEVKEAAPAPVEAAPEALTEEAQETESGDVESDRD